MQQINWIQYCTGHWFLGTWCMNTNVFLLEKDKAQPVNTRAVEEKVMQNKEEEASDPEGQLSNTKPTSLHESPPINRRILIYITRGRIYCQHSWRTSGLEDPGLHLRCTHITPQTTLSWRQPDPKQLKLSEPKTLLTVWRVQNKHNSSPKIK